MTTGVRHIPWYKISLLHLQNSRFYFIVQKFKLDTGSQEILNKSQKSLGLICNANIWFLQLQQEKNLFL